MNEALYYATPMLVIPVGNDQPRVAQQIEDLHLGKYLKRKELTPAILRDNTRKVLRDMSYKESILSFAEKSQAAGGNTEIARMILQVLSQIGDSLTRE